VLGAARIATTKVIPAMQRGAWSEVVAIASRDGDRARDAAGRLANPRAHDSYDALLEDPDVDAVYIPLPNHLHVPWSIRAIEHGKHVLCEKPIGLTAADAAPLIAARDRAGVVVQEAFMIRFHPQWQRAIAIVRDGRIGEVAAVVGHFSYDNRDPRNIRNIAPAGGGGLMDIGCYLVHAARWVFGREPVRVTSAIEMDLELRVDRLASFTLEFAPGQATGSCGTQHTPYQRVQILGTRGRIEIEVPFNAPSDRPCRIFVDNGADLFGGGVEGIAFDVCDQYTLQGDAVSRAILDGAPAPYPLEDSIANMRVIDAIRSGRQSST
jgi:predicted dehydrogenase